MSPLCAYAAGTISGVNATWSVVNERLVINYGNGWTQTATVVENNGIEYSVFSEYANATIGERYASYDIWVKGDPNFNLTESYLQSQAGQYWNGDINTWIPGFIDENGDRQLYVMEVEYRDTGLLFPARINIER